MREKRVLLIIILSSFITPFVASAVNIALPQIGKEMRIGALQMNWVASVFLLFTAIFLLPAGKLADLYSKLKLFKLGLLLFGVTSLAICLARSYIPLIALRIVQALGGAALFSTSVSLLVSIFPREQRGRLLGLNTATVYAGLSLGPVLGGVLTQRFGWRSIFFVVGVTAILVWGISQRGVGKERLPAARIGKIDWKGFLLYSAALILLMSGLSLAPSAAGWGLITAGTFLLVLFLFIEKREPEPLFDVRSFVSNRVFKYSNLAALVHYSATYAVGFLMSLYLQYFKGLSAQQAGFLLLVQPLVQSVFSPFAGKLSDRVEPALVASSGMALSASGLLLLLLVSPATSLVLVATVLALLGFGFALFSSPNTNAVMSSANRELYGRAAATLATMRMLGQMGSMGIVLFVFAQHLRQRAMSAALAKPFFLSLRQILVVFAILCLFGLWASLRRGELHGGDVASGAGG